MERIELFDHYISGTLSDAEAAEFRKRLDTDSELAADFRIYLLAVKGICQEAEQENIEFGHAMKSLTRERLCLIIGKNEKPHIVRPNYFREHLIWIASTAAMLILAVGIGWNIYSSSQGRLCDVVYSYAYTPIEFHRGDGRDYINLNKLSDNEIRSELPRLEALLAADEPDSQDWHIDGINLAMAYLRLHRKDDAVRVLKVMAAQAEQPGEYNRLLDSLK